MKLEEFCKCGNPRYKINFNLSCMGIVICDCGEPYPDLHEEIELKCQRIVALENDLKMERANIKGLIKALNKYKKEIRTGEKEIQELKIGQMNIIRG